MYHSRDDTQADAHTGSIIASRCPRVRARYRESVEMTYADLYEHRLSARKWLNYFLARGAVVKPVTWFHPPERLLLFFRPAPALTSGKTCRDLGDSRLKLHYNVQESGERVARAGVVYLH